MIAQHEVLGEHSKKTSSNVETLRSSNCTFIETNAYSTQRWMLFGNIDTKFQGFVDEVTPHEVAHQWWGHAVSWASYHDQWLSEGFAEFSAALFLEQARGEKDWVKEYTQFWERQQKRIFDKNNFGIAPNDAGPIWLGLRLISPRSEMPISRSLTPRALTFWQCYAQSCMTRRITTRTSSL